MEQIHVIITGSRQAGISSFISQKVDDYEAHDEVGIGIDIQTAEVYVNDNEYAVTFYEIAGTFPLDSLRKIFQKKHVGFALMFDLSNVVSLELAELLYNQIQAKIGNKMPSVKFLLGSHSDLEKSISQDSIDALLAIMGSNSYYQEFSAKTGDNLKEAMDFIAKKILDLTK